MSSDRMRRVGLALGLGALLLCAWTCGTDENPSTSEEHGKHAQNSYPPTAKVGIHEQFLEDLRSARHPSDGAGMVELVLAEGQDGSVVAGGFGRWEFVFTAGPLGIAEGGSLFLLVPPFWGWTTPQSSQPSRPGYTTVESANAGLELQPLTIDRNLLQIEMRGRALAAGETLKVVYGASEALARADDYAEDRSTFYFKVDGDGDGISGNVANTPFIRVLPGPAARLTTALSSTAAPSGRATLTVAVLDAMANAGCKLEGTLRLESVPSGLDLPKTVALTEANEGRVRIDIKTPNAGLFRVRVSLESSLLNGSRLSNPLRVASDQVPVYWADLHGHSYYSDGTGTPEQYFAYARDIAGLDFAVLTDHDHFGVRFLDANPSIWQEIREQVAEFHEPGRFLALPGYEWTSWLYGHRHVIYFDGQAEVLSSVGGDTTTPAELWSALRDRDALTFAHHSAGGPVGTDWSFVPDPRVEPVTEIMSIHGSSEASDSPSRIYAALKGNFVRDQLDHGLQFGFVGSGDSHDGHPGHAHLSPNAGYRRVPPDPLKHRAEERIGNGGVAAIRATELTSGAMLDALRTRHVYATSGERILLDSTLNGFPMGSTLALAQAGASASLRVDASGTSAIEYVEVLRRNAQTVRQLFEGHLDVRLDLELSNLKSGDYIYVRLVQNNGALAWSSPFFIE